MTAPNATPAPQMLRPGGMLFLGVPVGRDYVAYNAHRVYGAQRFPRLTAGWKVLGWVSSAQPYDTADAMFEVDNVDAHLQPWIVLTPA